MGTDGLFKCGFILFIIHTKWWMIKVKKITRILLMKMYSILLITLLQSHIIIIKILSCSFTTFFVSFRKFSHCITGI